MQQKKIFSKTLDWLQSRIDRGILNTTSAEILEEACGTFREELKDYFQKTRNKKLVSSKIKKDYYSYLNKDVFERNDGIAKVRITDLKPKFRKEFENRVRNSISLIKNKDEETKASLVSKLINFVTIDSEEVRGKEASANTFLRFLDFKEQDSKAQNHANFIMADQSRKMREAFDSIVREENGAIGAFWHNLGDRRVVGNPNGLYPKGNKAHGDHWEREGKFYIFADSWARKQGLVKGEIYENLEDGGVAVAIGCRCYLESIYDIRDIPLENLTKKGADYVASL